ncbi:hypothetical protein COJ85_14465 [Bacillus sp. AFS076308]|uniref:ArdC-like ssDNA-binding domain-containing protein n=1 Tax=unclassified Bacillus (in: firmicutes) TaxID=185979 RepID=UPI000BF4AC76|nr:MULTISPECIES: ArdC-like ssDNA-binding domain-containing protein [unclassified Bacillus (in: firmicutes)]PFO03298.1 hypothetical protein COJ85_14465 [Bacillus sp. AFS076308]PGV48612.1 hypothetical protein COD92_25645 [Bacillus sp. AFS037270]
MTKSVYEIITEKIIGKLEKCVAPWRQPWTNTNAVNWKTQKPYEESMFFWWSQGNMLPKNRF